MCTHSPNLGSISRAVSYLSAAADSRQRVRERVELLRGDPQQLIDLVNTLPPLADAGLGSAYDSIVLSFSPLDEPSPDQIRQLVAMLPTVMFPGGHDRLCWLAKLHSDGSSIHLHVLCAQVDLRTGLQFSLRALGLRPLKELCRYLNLRHGWTDPEDAFRRRLAWWSQDITGPGLPLGMGIHAHARTLAIAAVLEDRVSTQAEMAQVMQPLGKVVRLGHHSIILDVTTVALDGPRKPTIIKLSGLLYAKDFDRARVLRSLAPAPLPPAMTKRDTALEDRVLAEALFAKMLKDTKKRADVLAERYPVKPARARRSLVTRIANEVAASDVPTFDIELRHKQRTPRTPCKAVSNIFPVVTPVSGTSHDVTSSAHHPIHTFSHRQVPAAAGPFAGPATPAGGFARLGKALLEFVGTWVHHTLAPRVLEVAGRAIGTVLRDLLGTPNPAGRLDRSGSAFGALASATDQGVDTGVGDIGQERLGAISDQKMSPVDHDESNTDDRINRPWRAPKAGKRSG